MAGLAEKILEYLLETRIDAQHDDRLVDTLLDDFLLTHQIFMPTNMLSNYLKTYYQRGCSVSSSDDTYTMYVCIIGAKCIHRTISTGATATTADDRLSTANCM